ncbi:hypothetical protein BDF19DRAFT_425925 [Syncephalis fuscata]|nr:hypothetical protein BDF19DRAFT_425925 [Syncephalis fuscata]
MLLFNNNIWAALYAKEETRDEEEADAHLNTLQVPQERSSSRVSMTAELSAADRSTSRGSNRGSRLASENNSRTASPALETSHINAGRTICVKGLIGDHIDESVVRDAVSIEIQRGVDPNPKQVICYVEFATEEAFNEACKDKFQLMAGQKATISKMDTLNNGEGRARNNNHGKTNGRQKGRGNHSAKRTGGHNGHTSADD